MKLHLLCLRNAAAEEGALLEWCIFKFKGLTDAPAEASRVARAVAKEKRADSAPHHVTAHLERHFWFCHERVWIYAPLIALFSFMLQIIGQYLTHRYLDLEYRARKDDGKSKSPDRG